MLSFLQMHMNECKLLCLSIKKNWLNLQEKNLVSTYETVFSIFKLVTY